MAIVARHISPGRPLGGAVRGAFFDALNSLQEHAVLWSWKGPSWQFDDVDTLSLIRSGSGDALIGFADEQFLINSCDVNVVALAIDGALDELSRLSPALTELFETMIGAVSIYRIPSMRSGSFPARMGAIWLSPSRSWSRLDYVEMLVHELTHNLLYLHDMVHGLWGAPECLGEDRMLAISAIRGVPRPYDRAFHAACVQAVLMYLDSLSGEGHSCDLKFKILQEAIIDLQAKSGLSDAEGCRIVAEPGLAILEDLAGFAFSRDFDVLASALI